MNGLATEVADFVIGYVRDEVERLPNTRAELRVFLHGPPEDYLRGVLLELAARGVSAKTLNGELITVPVLLQTSSLPSGEGNPPLGSSGVCDESHLMALRNSPACRQYLVLVPPGVTQNLSITSASSEFGLSATANSRNATFDEWWADQFVHQLVDHALDKYQLATEQATARKLVELGAIAAESTKQGDSRREAWRVLSRLFSDPPPSLTSDPASTICLATGFPAFSGRLDSEQAVAILSRLADELGSGFRSGIDRIKQNTTELDDHTALNAFLAHLENRCELLTAFERSPAAFYGPCNGDELSEPPQWWQYLTVEKWSELLQEEEAEQDGLALTVASLAPPTRGGWAVAIDVPRLAITNTKGHQVKVLLQRFSGASKQPTASWLLDVDAKATLDDELLGEHKTAVRYVASADGYRPTSIKLVSLNHWAAGIYVSSRSATKLVPTRPVKASREKVALESYIQLAGPGRHFLDLFTSASVSVAPTVTGRDAAGEELGENNLRARVERVSDSQSGFEVDVPGDCFLDLQLMREGAPRPETLRLHIACDDIAPSNCGSEFERAIGLNRSEERGRSRYEVYVDRHVRCTDLESWILEEANCGQSFVPLVLGADYATAWAPPRWDGEYGHIYSEAVFLHDPRPRKQDFRPSARFVETRRAIAAKIRGTEGHGLLEEMSLGELTQREPDFAELVETYLSEYAAWLVSDPSIAPWVDIALVVSSSGSSRTLDQEPDAIIMSPLHPVRLAWHCVAQDVLHQAIRQGLPCPAATILDPDCVPDSLPLPLRLADGSIDYRPFVSVEVDSDYWSVLWNGSRLGTLQQRAQLAPFGADFGVEVGGLSSAFSAAQVVRALDDTQVMFSAKARLAVLIASSHGNSRACTQGVVDWAKKHLIGDLGRASGGMLGPRILEIYDARPASNSQPEDSSISNLTEDTGGAVRWFTRRPELSTPDLGIVAQLESSQPSVDERSDLRAPLSPTGLVRHRVRKQLPGGASAFLSETRQARLSTVRADSLGGKLAATISRLENLAGLNSAYMFAPNVAAIDDTLNKERAVLVAVSSATIDPACFLGQWLRGAYLWDYELPSFSRRAGDTNGYYLISKVRDAEREGLRKALTKLPGSDGSDERRHRETLLEVARRGIPTVRGLSGLDTSGTGDLGVFVASRLIQDEFRQSGPLGSLLPIIDGDGEKTRIAIVLPVDPFRSYLHDIARSLRSERRDVALARPDLLIVCVNISQGGARVRLTPVEVKCRQTSPLSGQACAEALKQARALSELLLSVRDRARNTELKIWELAFQHLVLSMVAFGMRVYSQKLADGPHARNWSRFHEEIAEGIFSASSDVEIDARGRLIVVDQSATSSERDFDGDGFKETLVVGWGDAGEIVHGNPVKLYALVRARLGDWDLFPLESTNSSSNSEVDVARSVASSLTEVKAQKFVHMVTTPPDQPTVPSIPKVKLAPAPSEQAKSGAGHDESAPGVVLEIGTSVDDFSRDVRYLNLSDTALNQLNVGVVGDLGTGKTQLLKSLIYQLTVSSANAGIRPRVLIFDYKKDYSSEDFVSAVGATVVRPHRLPINIFDTRNLQDSSTPWLDRFSFFADVLDKIYSGIGPVQRNNLKQAVKRAYETAAALGTQPTLKDVHREYGAIVGTKPDSPFAIIDDLIDREIFSEDGAVAGSFAEFFDGVVVVALSSLGQDDRAKNMVVAAMLNMFYEHMLKIPKRPFRGSSPQLRTIDSYLLVDEADNIMQYEFDVLKKILLQGREFGVGVILASQYLKHFRAGATDYREPLLTWFVHKVPNVTAQDLAALGLSSDAAELAARVKNLPNHQCLYKSAQVGGEVILGAPFYQIVAREKK
ncbi:MAG: ATP-binding protein [Pseudomonadota bacterium]